MLPSWIQDDLEVNGTRIHYTRTGRGEKPPLVLVHGFSDNGLCWTPVARTLEGDYDVIMPDMRGHGLSARVKPDEQVDMAADLAELIRTLGLHRPIVGGHSMGAMVTYQIGVRFSELASALILEDPPWWLEQPVPLTPGVQPAEEPFVTWAKGLRNQTLEELLVAYREDHPDWPNELLRPMCESKKQLDTTVVDTMSKRLHLERTNWLATIGSIPHPMLVFTADPDLGAIVTPQAAAKARELNPKVTLVHVPNVGHLIRFDNFPVFMNALRKFLKEVSRVEQAD
ncbi:MAG TPA: alpha/beta hydrolase [Anaerolinea sp.]|nr:alpha/beta hydrolase [Anaerolinea sp.]